MHESLGPIVQSNQFDEIFGTLINLQTVDDQGQEAIVQVLMADETSWDKPHTYTDEYGQDVCPLTDITCQEIFLNAQQIQEIDVETFKAEI